MKKAIISLGIIMTCLHTAVANDGVYYTSGNFLVPAQETDIAASKEILTITIGEDRFATVDVYYEFTNTGKPKTVNMAFEAMPPYNATSEPLNRNGIHPHIADFTVNMNGEPLAYSNGVVALPMQDDCHKMDFEPLDLTKWKGYGEVSDEILPAENALYNAELDSITQYAYAYYFKASFKEGKNVVRHTYRYKMSYSVAESFSIPYWLTPVNRWANHKVDDFTLQITSDGHTEFCLTDTLFGGAPFISKKGAEIYHLSSQYDESFIFASVSKGDTISWHSNDFHPAADINIHAPSWDGCNLMNRHETSAKVAVSDDGKEVARYLADCGDCYFIDVQDYGLAKKSEWHLETYDAAKGHGWLLIDGQEAKKVEIRKKPSDKGKIIGYAECTGEIPDALPCRGIVTSHDGSTWFKTTLNGKTGYAKTDSMIWQAVYSD